MSKNTRNSSPVGLSRLLSFLSIVATLYNTDAFQVSTNPSSVIKTARWSSSPSSSFGPASPLGISSNLISQLAVVALKLRLKDQAGVVCNVESRSSELLLGGRVGPVTVKGRGWQSGLGLTCRAIDATVDTCELDVARVLSKRKLRLIRPANGKAMVALNSLDFGNFITHPLLKPPALMDAGGEISFCRDGSVVDPTTGSVVFYATTSQYEGARWKCVLKRGEEDDSRAIIEVSLAEGGVEEAEDTSEQMSRLLSDFFNKMVFELDGTFLSFRDMMITDKGEAPSVMLALNIVVHKFPSPGLEF